MDSRRRDVDVTATERPREAAWLSATLADEGWDVPPEAAERLLDLHRAYLDAAPELSPEADQPDPATLDAPMAPDGDAPEALETPDAPEARDAPAGAGVT